MYDNQKQMGNLSISAKMWGGWGCCWFVVWGWWRTTYRSSDISDRKAPSIPEFQIERSEPSSTLLLLLHLRITAQIFNLFARRSCIGTAGQCPLRWGGDGAFEASGNGKQWRWWRRDASSCSRESSFDQSHLVLAHDFQRNVIVIWRWCEWLWFWRFLLPFILFLFFSLHSPRLHVPKQSNRRIGSECRYFMVESRTCAWPTSLILLVRWLTGPIMGWGWRWHGHLSTI